MKMEDPKKNEILSDHNNADAARPTYNCYLHGEMLILQIFPKVTKRFPGIPQNANTGTLARISNSVF